MPSALRVFISHSHEDESFCRALVAALRGAGADVWYDEHNMGAGHLMDVIQKELERRTIFIVILSKNAFASTWVRKEAGWAYVLAERDPTRIILPITVGSIEHSDFSGTSGWLFLEEFKRIEAPGYQPYLPAEAIGRVLHTLALTPVDEARTPVAPQPTESVEDLINRGTKLREIAGHDAEALALFERATQLDPKSYVAWLNVAETLGDLGRFERALLACDRAISLNQADPTARLYKGGALLGLKRDSEAMAAIEEALSLDPKFADGWYAKGHVLIEWRHYREALAAIEEALSLDPRMALHG